MDVTSRTELRGVIKFCSEAGMTPIDTLKFISKGPTSVKCSRSLVFKWHQRFSTGDTSLEDRSRSGRRKITDADEILKVENMLDEDRRKTVRDLADKLDLKRSTVHNVLKKDLKMKKVSARWVPQILKDEEKQQRVLCSTEFLSRYEREGDRFLRRIITIDETWIHLYEPESKRESMVWKRSQSPPPMKAMRAKSAHKFMFIFFMDMDGMQLQHAVPRGTTVNAEYYQKVFCFLVCLKKTG